MKPPFDIAADLDTPVSAFLKLGPLGPRFLLESVERGESLGRYSFIGFGEALDFRLDHDGVVLGDDHRPRPADEKALLAVLREALGKAPRPLPADASSPLSGGLVGVSAYEMVRYFERLPARGCTDFAVPEAVYVAPRSLLVFDHLSRRVALLHAGPEDESRSLHREVTRALRGAVPDSPRIVRHQAPVASLEKSAFEDRVRRIKQHITDGDVYQLVVSICFSGRGDLAPFEVYRALRLLNPSPYMYYCDFGDLTVIGSSPEALVKAEGGHVWLRPIAGTRPRGRDEEQDQVLRKELLADPKEAAEHVMLVDLARNDLGRVALPGSVHVDPYMTVERYSHVMHMVSGVKGRLTPEHDIFDLFAATFPAGTVVGAPKVRAMELIDELEPTPRGIYAGTVGYFGQGGSMDQAIAIRTLVFQGDTYSYQAGAGIVADSIPEREHAEVLAKSAALEGALILAEEGL